MRLLGESAEIARVMFFDTEAKTFVGTVVFKASAVKSDPAISIARRLEIGLKAGLALLFWSGLFSRLHLTYSRIRFISDASLPELRPSMRILLG
jgi:hypothetical protein